MDAVGVTATSGSIGAVESNWYLSMPLLRNWKAVCNSWLKLLPIPAWGIQPLWFSPTTHNEDPTMCPLQCSLYYPMQESSSYHHNIAQLVSLLTSKVLTLARAVLKEASSLIISLYSCYGLALILHQRARSWLLALKRWLTVHIHIHVFKG